MGGNQVKQQGKSNPGSLEQRLRAHPELKARVERLLEIVEDAGGDWQKADAAEQRVIEELRQMGQQILQGWAQGQEHKQSQEVEQKPGMRRKGKKTLLVQLLRGYPDPRAGLHPRTERAVDPPLLPISRCQVPRLFAALTTRHYRFRSRCHLCPPPGEVARTLWHSGA